MFAVEWFHSLESSGDAGLNPAAPSNPFDYIEPPCARNEEPQDNSANRSVNETPVSQLSSVPLEVPAALAIGTGAKQYMLAARLSSVATAYRPKSKTSQRITARTKADKKKIVRRHVRLSRPAQDKLLQLKALAAAVNLQDNAAAARTDFFEQMAA